tara:strand:+ start:56 stop:967 length:912 start_codon:yes stop_codon:yes gene_type:complete
MSDILVFPRMKPLGTSSSSKTSVRGKASFPTEVVDYLKLNIYEHVKGRDKNKNKGSGRVTNTVYLYLPPGLNEKYSAKYEGKNLGKVGSDVVDAASNIRSGGDIGDNIAAAADAAKPALAFKLGSTAINALVGEVGPYGSSLDSNDLAQLTGGQIFNPYEEMLFKGVSFISHSFKFTLMPKSAQDVQTIYEIINVLRQSMHPSKDGENWLNIPDKFSAEIVRYSSDGDDESLGEGKSAKGYMASLLRFPYKMVLQDMSLDFGDSTAIRTQVPGQATQDYGFAVYNMTLTFQEIKYRTREDFAS